MEKRKSQKELILEHLQSGQSLTELEGLIEYGVGHLSGRIRELKLDGYDIVTDRVEVAKKNGGYANIARYSLRPKEQKVEQTQYKSKIFADILKKIGK